MTKRLDRVAARLRSPRAWRVRTRRLFLLTLPLSLPLWLLALVALGAVFAARAVFRPVVTFWNAPPKRGRYNYYGGYGDSGRARRDNVVPLPARQAADVEAPQAERG